MAAVARSTFLDRADQIQDRGFSWGSAETIAGTRQRVGPRE
jgi:hypothetical protein